MEEKIEKLISLAGNENKYQYMMLFVTVLIWINVDILPISLPFLEKQPDIVYFDADGRVVHSQLNYTICEKNSLRYNITQTYFYSWVIEYQIECDSLITGLIGSLCFLGSFISSFIFQSMVTNYGRKPTVLFNMLCFCFMLGLFYFSGNITMILVFAFIAQLTPASICLGSFMLCSETLSQSKRSIFGAIINCGFCICGIIYILLYKYLQNWRIVFLASAITTLLCVLLFYYVAIESPRYYLSKGKIQNFIAVLIKIAHYNNKKEEFCKQIWEEDSQYKQIVNELLDKYEKKNSIIPHQSYQAKNKILNDDVLNNLLSKNENEQFENQNLGQSTSMMTNDRKEVSSFALIKYRSQRTYFLISCFLWFSVSGNYYGLTINLKNLPGDIYFNGIIIYIFEMISYLCSSYIINIPQIGRRGTIFFYYFIAALGNFILMTAYIPEVYHLIITFCTRFAVAGVFNILFTYCCEIYPTVVRAEGFGYNSACGKIGSIVFPLIVEIFSKYVNFVFAGINCLCFSLMFFMPETLGKPLMENIPELNECENFEDKEYKNFL